MKQKLFTLLTLVLCLCTGAWADDVTVTYKLAQGDAFTSGQTVTVYDTNNQQVATITYGESGGENFCAAKAGDQVTGFDAYTEGNGTNGNKTGGTFYTIVPQYDGSIEIAVIINKDKTFIVEENGESLSGYSAEEAKLYGTKTFSVTAGKSYKCYVSGSKMGLYGFKYTYTAAATPTETYNVTYKANNGTEEEDIVVTEASKVAANTFTVPSGKFFSGWNTSADGSGTLYAVGATVTSDLTLYAQFKISALYSMTNPTAPTGNLDPATGSDVTATLSGGTAYVYNGKSSAAAMITNNQINLGGSGGSYFLATITTEGKKIAVGDIIKISNSNANFRISGTDTKPGEASDFTNGEYIVPEGSNLVNSTTVYIWKGNTSTFSSFTITPTDPSHVATPVISFSENKATITCKTKDVTIRYTLDGTEPTNSSTEYSEAVDLTNSCTVRAKAFKETYQSSEASKDCYVDHSSAENFLTILKFNGGSVGTGDDAKVWTSSDGKYVLTDLNNAQTDKWSSLEGSQDAFKLSHVDGYTLAVPSNVKITKVAFIGKSLYGNLAGSVAVTTEGFTPTNASFIKNADEEGFVQYLSTIEFNNSSLNFGDAIAFNPGGCESAAYIEIYGEELVLTPKKQYITLTSAYNLDFTNVDGLDAYIVKAEDVSESTVTLTQVNKVPAGTGLVLKGTPNTKYTLATYEGNGDDVSGNKMVGSATAETTPVTGAAYILSNGEFHPWSGEGNIAAGKAYLNVNSAGAKALSINFSDFTGISNAEANEASKTDSDKMYNLSGQLVGEGYKGIVIVNGKKVIK